MQKEGILCGLLIKKKSFELKKFRRNFTMFEMKLINGACLLIQI